MIYIPANENLCAAMIGRPVTYTAGRGFTGATNVAADRARRRSHRRGAGVERRHRQARVDAHVSLVDATGGRCWRPAAGWCSAAARRIGCSARSTPRAARLLWEFPTNSGIIGQPSSFTVDGRQYIAVQSGWGIDARAMQGRLNRIAPGEYPDVPEGGAVWVFAVK